MAKIVLIDSGGIVALKRDRDSSNTIIDELKQRYAERHPNVATRAALKEKSGKARRYKSAAQVLKALKARCAR